MRKQEDQGSPWPEGLHLQLLRASLLDGEDSTEAFHQWSSAVVFDELDYPSIGLMPLLRWNLKRQGITHPLMPRIESVGRYLLLETMMKLGALGALLSDLNRVEIPSLLLWGASIGRQYYPQPALRPVNRCGVLIHSEHWEHAMQHLILKGWNSSPSDNDDGKELGRVQRTEYPNVSIQLCRGISIGSTPQDGGQVWENAREILFQGTGCGALHPVDEIVQACREGYRHGTALSSKLWLVDCTMIVRSSVFSNGWQDLEETVQDPGGALLVRETLDWISRLGRSVFQPLLPNKARSV